jgi:hypothetical protein
LFAAVDYGREAVARARLDSFDPDFILKKGIVVGSRQVSSMMCKQQRFGIGIPPE